MDIYILCHNEEVMIPHTIKHYRDRFPTARIFIYDNYSSDESVALAQSLGCEVIMWEYNVDTFEFDLTKLKNNIWKQSSGWVIVCDMDEWLCIDEAQLKEEESKGTTMLMTEGYQIIADSNSEKLDDIILETLSNGFYALSVCKKLCFDSRAIKEINYLPGAHVSNPEGDVVLSAAIYHIKHMDFLGLPYKWKKMLLRFERTREMRKYGMAVHYHTDYDKLKVDHINMIRGSHKLEFLKN